LRRVYNAEITVLSGVMPCSSVFKYQCFGGVHCLHLQLCCKDKGSIFLQNGGACLPECTTSHPRRVIFIISTMRTTDLAIYHMMWLHLQWLIGYCYQIVIYFAFILFIVYFVLWQVHSLSTVNSPDRVM
jgi:hypothetical protein